MMTMLSELRPRITPWGPALYQSVYFLCPRCRKHEIGVEIWNGPSGIHDVGLKDAKGNPAPIKIWHATQGPNRDWETLTITPSINAGGSEYHECPGWHGSITNGEVQP